jgi:hypothetical protein
MASLPRVLTVSTNPLIQQTFDLFASRRVTPLQLSLKNIAGSTLTRLAGRFFAVDLRNDADKPLASLFAQIAEQKAELNDAVILLPDEPPDVFLASNARLAISPNDPITYELFVGQRMTSVTKIDDKAIWESEDRALLLADVVVNHLSRITSQRLRAVTFLNAILPLHAAALRWMMLTKNTNALRQALKILDELEPLALLQPKGSLAGIDRDKLKDYVSVVISARGRSATPIEPAQHELLERDRAFLRQI